MASSRRSVTSASSRSPASAAPPAKRFGSETPRIFTPPLRKLTPSTSLGFECIKFADEVLELDLLPWQKWLLVHALELLEDGNFRFRKIVLLVGRQNGKSTVMQALTLWRMYVDRCTLVIGTAQDLEVAESLWAEAVEMAQDIPDLAAEIAVSGGIVKTNGKKLLKLTSGETYKVKAATRRGGRGLSGELVLLDELREHQSWDAWAAVTKTTNAKERAQIWGISNAGDASSIVLRYLRKMAHESLGNPDNLDDIVEADEDLEDDLADGDSLAIFEWSAPQGCRIGDRDGWAQANPALGHLIREATLAGDAKTDPEWVFRTEVLCQWSSGTLDGPFPPGSWEACLDVTSNIAAAVRIGVGIDQSADRSFTHISFAGLDQNGAPHVEVVASRAGSEWVRQWLESPDRGSRDQWVGIAGQSKGAPVSALMADLTDAGLPVVDWQGSDLSAWSGKFYDLVRNTGLRHLEQPVLDVAAATAVTKPSGDAWLWNRSGSPTDIAPLVAATAALFALLASPEPTVSAYEDSNLMVV